MESGRSVVPPSARIITVGGGKGGVGKSTIAAGIACQLSCQNKQVVLVDADLRGANLHLCIGIRYPEKGLHDFLSGNVANIQDILINTSITGVNLISGAGSMHEITDPRFGEKQKLLKAFSNLKADYVVIDVGAGADEDNTDFFSLSSYGVVILTNEPSSVENAYSFIKNSMIRKFIKMFPDNDVVQSAIKAYSNPKDKSVRRIDELISRVGDADPESARALSLAHTSFRPCLVINMVRSKLDVQVEASFRSIVNKFLGIHITYIGYVVYDDAVPASIKKISPLASFADAPSVRCLKAITENLIALGRPNG